MRLPRNPISRFSDGLVRIFGGEAGAGLLLILIAAIALAVANSALAPAYHWLFHHPIELTPFARLNTLHAWINDALMALFFFVVGLEIKRELLVGALSTGAQRKLPVLAAGAGMVVPAAIYLAVAGGDPALVRGWAIPAATDIAFAIGVLGLLGKRAPPALRLFLLAVAILDDLGAVAIIALVYAETIDPAWLAAAAAILAGMVALGRWQVTRHWPYVIGALALWYAVLHSGVHPTVAGVLAALTIPLRLDREGDSPLLRMEHTLVPWSAYLVVPLFGFANAGVALTGGAGPGSALPLGIALGLLLGKQAGVFGAIWLADRIGFAARPEGASWLQLWGMALLCGIGFTMSLFIAQLAFPGQAALVEEAKLGVLAGSLGSALLGFAVLRWAKREG